MDPTSEAARRLYVGNIPRTATNDDLQKVFEEHGDVEKVEVFDLWVLFDFGRVCWVL
ncbi:putative RNA recognition motif domain, nucleotide-binding alpha-beta plait domain superfamily [Helianthus debilis subsp. tardiflorus]